jgi:DNA-binding NtrC family response regulator
MRTPLALLVCRCPAIVQSVREALGNIEYLRLEVCADAQQVGREVKRKDIVLVLAHLGSLGGDAEATNLLWSVAATRRACPTLLLAEDYHEQHADALLRAGAADFLELPVDLEKLAQLAVALTLRVHFPPRGAAPVTEEPQLEEALQELVTADMGDVISQVRRVAPQDTTLLLSGETGTGKTVLARLIHELSPRRNEPFLVVDCAALSAGVIESELFGHVKGAFTGAERDRQGKLVAAGDGTLLLDEVNSLPLHLQSKLLRAVGERSVEPVGAVRSVPVRARVLAASNVSLEDEVAAGRFRADLYYRLNVVGFHLPPLRERRAALAPLAHRFLEEYAERNRLKVRGFRADALQALEAHHWPGNIRELRNVVERAVALCEWGEIGLDDLPASFRSLTPLPRRAVTACTPLHRSREEAEIQQIREALHKHRNNRMRAAAELGISRMGLYKKLHKYGFI